MMVVLRVIVEDMLINVACTFLAIFFVSLVFTLDVVISFFTRCTVAATVVDAAGLLFFWGVSIDPFFAVASFLVHPVHITSISPRCFCPWQLDLTSTTLCTWPTVSLSRFLCLNLASFELFYHFSSVPQEGPNRSARMTTSLARF